MNSKNCPNCGAVYTLEDVKCPYCGTLYFDMTAIDFTSNKPIFLKMKLPYGCITQCVRPRFDSINFNHDYYDVVDHSGVIINKIYTGTNMITNIHFDAIPYGKDKKLIEVNF